MNAKRILVTGATGGIGSALVRRLVGGGHRTFLAARDGGRLAELAEEVRSPWASFDLRSQAEVEECVSAAAEQLGGLDGVAHCVGSLLLKPCHATSSDEFDDILATNLTSAFHLVRSSAPVLRRGGGSVVLVSTAAARVGLANHEAIAAAKAGVEGLALSAAATYASAGVRFNVVAPGLVESSMTSLLTSNPITRKASEAMHALGRLGEPDDVASCMVWLLESEWVTGQVVGVDGGLSHVRPRQQRVEA